MNLLDSIIERLNHAVDAHNAKVAAAVEEMRLAEADAVKWRLPPGCVTREIVHAGPSRWPIALRRAVKNIVRPESPDEIMRMCDACSQTTDTIKHLRLGAKRASGANPGPLKGLPVCIRLMDMAHLVSRSDAGCAVLLG